MNAKNLKGCGKIPYYSERDAYFAMSQVLLVKKKKRQENRVYLCDICTNGKDEVYHLTSSPLKTK